MAVHTVKKLEWKHTDSGTKLAATGGSYDDGSKVLTLTGVSVTGITPGNSIKGFEGTISVSVFAPNLVATQSKTVVAGPTLKDKKAKCETYNGNAASFKVS